MSEFELNLKITAQDQASSAVQAVANKTKQANQAIKNSTKQSESEQQQAKKKTAQVSQELATKAEMHAKRVAQAKKTLEIKTERDLQIELRKTQQAYQVLAKSGTASARDLAKAREAVIRKERELRAEMGKNPLGQRVATAGKATAGLIVAGMAAKQVLTPAMNDRKQWDANATNVALQAFGDKDVNYIRTQCISQIQEAVKSTVKNVGGTHDQALGTLNAMMVNGLDFDVAKNMLPQAQMMQVAGEASSDDIGDLIKVLSDYGFKGDALADAFNHALRSGMDGKFEIGDMVRSLPEILSKAKGVGFTGMKDFDYILAWLQSAANKAGTNSEAANNVGNALEKLNAEDTTKRLRKIDNPKAKGKGINWDDSKLKARAEGKNPMEALNLLADQMLEVDKEYKKLKAKLSKATTDEEKNNIQAQLNLKKGIIFSRLYPDVQAKAGLVASAEKEEMQGYMGNTQNKEFTQGLDYKRFTLTMGTDKAIGEQKDSLAFLNEGLSSHLNKAERVWNEFWLDLGRENPEMLGMYADLKLGLSAVAAAAGAAAVSLAALGGKDLLASVLETLGKGKNGSLGGASGGKGAPKVGGKGFGLGWLAKAGVVAELAFHSNELNAGEDDAISARMEKMKASGNMYVSPTHKQAVNSASSFASGAIGVAQMASQIGAISTQQSAVNNVLAQYQADFNAFGQTISAGIQAGLAAQSHTINNRIMVELDGAVIAENVSQRQFQFFKRG